MATIAVQTIEWLREADAFVLNVLGIAWRAFADTVHVDPMAPMTIIMFPGMISIATLLAIGYACFMARR